MNELYHVALAFDDNYLEQTIVLMTSILLNKNDNEEIVFHVLDGGLNEFSKSRLNEMENCSVKYHAVDKKMFEGYKKSDYYPVSMLWTMILPDLIKVDRIIYFDSDVIVNTSLNELWYTDIGDNYIAAVEDPNGVKYAKRYKLPSGVRFFNTGVMVLNCKKWKENKISERGVKFSLEHTGTPMGYDQNILNVLFEGKVKFLDLKWNVQFCPINIWPSYKDLKEYKNAIKNPCIIHYVGDYKPWKQGFGCLNPLQEDYLKYHKLTYFAYENYDKWQKEDKAQKSKGFIAFIKRYPTFFAKKQYWRNFKFLLDLHKA